MAEAADFFVSYTSSDRAWAEWIAWQLEAEGYQVVVQAWDFAPGHDWVHEMHEATSKAERVVAVLSPAYLRSGHGEAEWRAFYAKDPSGERGLLLAVRVNDVEPLGLLTTRIYVDLVGRDATGAREVLLAAARGARGKPATEPEFPGDQRPQPSVTKAPRFPGRSGVRRRIGAYAVIAVLILIIMVALVLQWVSADHGSKGGSVLPTATSSSTASLPSQLVGSWRGTITQLDDAGTRRFGLDLTLQSQPGATIVGSLTGPRLLVHPL